MKDVIVQTSKCVTLVGAGDASKGQLVVAQRFAPYLIAADGGAQLVLNCGITPKKVIGDFDSIDKQVLDQIPESNRIFIAEQESTDFEKCLRTVRAPLILGIGFLGARLDHQLAALSALYQCRHSPCVLIGPDDLVFHLAGKLSLDLPLGSRISLFPMAPVRGNASGLKWPITDLLLSPVGKTAVSNQVTIGKVHLDIPEPGILVILPVAALSVVCAALNATNSMNI